MQLSDDRRTVNAFELQVLIKFILIRRLFVILIDLIITYILAIAMHRNCNCNDDHDTIYNTYDDDSDGRSSWRLAYPTTTSKVVPALKSADRFVFITITTSIISTINTISTISSISISKIALTCAQVVVAMDRERGSLGRLGYSEFKDLIVSLKMWQVMVLMRMMLMMLEILMACTS